MAMALMIIGHKEPVEMALKLRVLGLRGQDRPR